MGSSGTFLKVMGTLAFFNLIFYLTGLMTSFIDVSGLIATFLLLGVVIVIVSFIPTTSAGGSIRWFLSAIIITSIIFKIGPYTILEIPRVEIPQIGIGLCTNIMDIFGLDFNSFNFIPYLGFLFLGMIGLISGIMAMNSGGD